MRRMTRLAAMLAAMACIGANAMADGMRESERMRATWWRGTPPAGDLLSISAGTIEEPDIVWSPRVPWVGEEVTISARVRGEGAAKPVDVRFVVEGPDGNVVKLHAENAGKEVDGQFADYTSAWKPTETGFHKITVQIDPEKKSGDPFVDNNTAEVVIPVTWTELHLMSWASPRRCRWVGTAAYVDKPEDIPYWRRRGTRPLGYMYVIERNLVGKSQEELTRIILGNAKNIAEAGYDGYLIDELGSYPTEESMGYIRRIQAAYTAVRKQYPKLQGYNWTGGGMLREEADMARSVGHILMTESYPDLLTLNFGSHSFEKRLENRMQAARNVDALFTHGGRACTIVALGIGGDCGVPWRPHVENWVRVCRKLAPEAPGICYYPGGQSEVWNDPKEDYQAFLDDLTMKYFIKPVLTIKETDLFLSDYDLEPGKAVTVIARIRNIGGMAAKNVGVRIYARWLATGQRTLIHDTAVPEIGNGVRRIQENDPASYELREINGTTYPAMYYRGRAEVGTTTVYVDRALVTGAWTPKSAGYYRIEVEIVPSDDYTILDGFEGLEAPVAGDI